MEKVVIVGGGASGMLSAIGCAKNGNKVTLIEKNQRVGKKLLATGNGRCNLTNINASEDYYFGNNNKFVNKVLDRFTVKDTIEYFENLGISCKEEDEGKIFPRSDQASSILDVLRYKMQKLDIDIQLEQTVKSIQKKKDRFHITTLEDKKYTSDKVILCTGGKSLTTDKKGCTGYEIASSLGHSIVPLFPSLVQLTLKGKYFKRIDGVKIYSRAYLTDEKENILDSFISDILFTSYGISGPAILQLSKVAGEYLQKDKKIYINVNIIDKTPEEIFTILEKRISISPEKNTEFFMVGLINKRLIPVILLESGITNMKNPCSTLSKNQILSISHTLSNLKYQITGNRGWQFAQVTSGGINTDEIDNLTMQSKIVKGLYFAGEVVDIDGRCGGFNLQWCWSSAYVASLLE